MELGRAFREFFMAVGASISFSGRKSLYTLGTPTVNEAMRDTSMTVCKSYRAAFEKVKKRAEKRAA